MEIIQMVDGISVTRHTAASYAPLPVQIYTDLGSWQLSLAGTASHYRVPGNKLRAVAIAGTELFRVLVVTTDGEEIEYEDGLEIDNVMAITISDGFQWYPPALLNWTYVQPYVSGGYVFDRGYDIIAPPPFPRPF